MREKVINTIIIIISIFILIQLFINKTLIYSSILYALNIWFNNLLPTLFPFFIISDILINYNITMYIPTFIKEKCKQLLGINDNILCILLLSMISGFPSNARNTRNFYDKGLISLDEGNHILMFSHFANPFFVVVTIGGYFFNNQRWGIILLLAHYLSNLGVALIFKGKFKHANNPTPNEIITNNFGEVLVLSIKKAIDTILLIGGIVAVFLTFSAIVLSTFNLSGYKATIINGLLEITIGIDKLSKINILFRYKLVIASCMLAFGGFSVHLQVISQIVGTRIKYIYYFIGRMYQMIFAGIITYIICYFLGI